MARTGDGQTALVIGASAGIGVDLAECFAKDGNDGWRANRRVGRRVKKYGDHRAQAHHEPR